jgi:4-hydroxybenzoate polyprenyltransferase
MPLKSFFKLTRLNQPIGIFLLFLPCLFGIALNLKELPQLNLLEIYHLIFLFFLGSIIMRSAGCVINDLLDQKFDKEVARTKIRPLASGEISKNQAILLLVMLLSAGLTVLCNFNLVTILSGFFAVILVITYPLMKRITYYPQVFLGLTFNFGILMSGLALVENITFSTSILYGFAIIWTVVYDTIYAYQDVEDDLKIGVKSTAIKFGENPQKILLGLNFIMFLILILLGWHEKFRAEYFITILLADLYLNSQIKNCDFKQPKKCLQVFKSNIWFGSLIALALFLG